jgi:hypothetical protein
VILVDDELVKNYETTRYRFIRIDLDTCSTALDMGFLHRSLGNIEIALSEVDMVARGIETIEHFLAGMPPEQKTRLEEDLGEIKRRHEALKASLGAASGS